jgi:hypothetical protein
MDNIPMTTSPALIVVICAVAVVCLAVWLTAIMVAARGPRAPRRDSAALPGSVLGGMHLAAGGRSVAPNRDTAAVSVPAQMAPASTAAVQAAPAQTVPAGPAAADPAPPPEAPRAAPARIPGQRQGASPEPEATSPRDAAPAPAPAVPTPRESDADRPAPTGTGA